MMLDASIVMRDEQAGSDESFTAWALGTGAGGNVRTTSLRAYDEAQFAKIADRAG